MSQFRPDPSSTMSSTSSYYSNQQPIRQPPTFVRPPTGMSSISLPRTSTQVLRDDLVNERVRAAQLESRLAALETQSRSIPPVAHPAQSPPVYNGASARASLSNSTSDGQFDKRLRSNTLSSVASTDSLVKGRNQFALEDDTAKANLKRSITPLSLLLLVLLLVTIATAFVALFNDNWASLAIDLPIIGVVELPITLGPVNSSILGETMNNLELLADVQELLENLNLPPILENILEAIIDLVVPNLDQIFDSFIASTILGIAGAVTAIFAVFYLVFKLFSRRKFYEGVMLFLVFTSFVLFLIATQLFDNEVAGGIDENGLLMSELQTGFDWAYVPVATGAAALLVQIIITLQANRDANNVKQMEMVPV